MNVCASLEAELLSLGCTAKRALPVDLQLDDADPTRRQALLRFGGNPASLFRFRRGFLFLRGSSFQSGPLLWACSSSRSFPASSSSAARPGLLLHRCHSGSFCRLRSREAAAAHPDCDGPLHKGSTQRSRFAAGARGGICTPTPLDDTHREGSPRLQQQRQCQVPSNRGSLLLAAIKISVVVHFLILCERWLSRVHFVRSTYLVVVNFTPRTLSLILTIYSFCPCNC
jgi:hypothetical protein